MAKYTSVSISGYNATPPDDDGTVSEANKIKWSTGKTKLTDPIKTALESLNTNLVSAFDVGPTALTTSTTLGTTHYGDFIQVSGSSITLTLTDAATLGAGWHCHIRSTDTNNLTLARATGGDTINGTAANITLVGGDSGIVYVNAAANGFYTEGFILGLNNTFTGDNAHSGAETFVTLAMSSTLSSTKAAESGYTRLTPNLCRVNAKPAETALVRDTITEVTGPTGCKGLVLLLVPVAGANNGVADRYSDIAVYSEVGATNQIAHATARGYESPAITAGLFINQTRVEVHVKTDGSGRVWVRQSDDTGNQGLGYYAIMGYYD